MTEAESAWQRPAPGSGEPDLLALAYSGPPIGEPAAPDWHPPVLDRVEAPRHLPDLDHESIDLEERQAARLTLTVGMTAAGALLLVACVRLLA